MWWITTQKITGNYDHIPIPAKIEMKQSLLKVRRKSSQSRDTSHLIIQETQATMSGEAVTNYPSMKDPKKTETH